MGWYVTFSNSPISALDTLDLVFDIAEEGNPIQLRWRNVLPLRSLAFLLVVGADADELVVVVLQAHLDGHGASTARYASRYLRGISSPWHSAP